MPTEVVFRAEYATTGSGSYATHTNDVTVTAVVDDGIMTSAMP